MRVRLRAKTNKICSLAFHKITKKKPIVKPTMIGQQGAYRFCQYCGEQISLRNSIILDFLLSENLHMGKGICFPFYKIKSINEDTKTNGTMYNESLCI